MAGYAGSLDELVAKIYELEAHGTIGRRVTDLLVRDARRARESGFQIAKKGRAVDNDAKPRFLTLAQGLESCGLIDSAQYATLLQLIEDTFLEGADTYRTGGSLNLCRVERSQRSKKFKLPQGVNLQPTTPLAVLWDLGVPKRLCDKFWDEGWQTVGDVPRAVKPLLELPGVSYGTIAAYRRILIENNYAG